MCNEDTRRSGQPVIRIIYHSSVVEIEGVVSLPFLCTHIFAQFL